MTAKTPAMKAPFPYFGGKSRVASLVWERFGDVRNYVEPFFGSGAVLLGRPTPFRGVETVNDADGFIANFWRAVQADPEAVARWAEWPVNENDLHARHAWLVERRDSLQSRLEGDPDWHDAKIAGWWVWAACVWWGERFADGRGPWRVVVVDGEKHLLRRTKRGGKGVCRTRPALSDSGVGFNRPGVDVPALMADLSARLRRVRVCCGDWARVTGPIATTEHGLTAVFLDPPYARESGRAADLYSTDGTRDDGFTVSHDVREWAIANGDNPKLRIALCGFEGEHAMPDSWPVVAWKTSGGMGNHAKGGYANASRERIWFSPHCLRPDVNAEPTLFEAAT